MPTAKHFFYFFISVRCAIRRENFFKNSTYNKKKMKKKRKCIFPNDGGTYMYVHAYTQKERFFFYTRTHTHTHNCAVYTPKPNCVQEGKEFRVSLTAARDCTHQYFYTHWSSAALRSRSPNIPLFDGENAKKESLDQKNCLFFFF